MISCVCLRALVCGRASLQLWIRGRLKRNSRFITVITFMTEMKRRADVRAPQKYAPELTFPCFHAIFYFFFTIPLLFFYPSFFSTGTRNRLLIILCQQIAICYRRRRGRYRGGSRILQLFREAFASFEFNVTRTHSLLTNGWLSSGTHT